MHGPKIGATFVSFGDENGQSESWFNVSGSALKAA
jgi:hypothetical protein